MNALLGNELIEILSLEKLVNESRSLCHIVSILIQIKDILGDIEIQQKHMISFQFPLRSHVPP